jgi:DNA-binding transcriptional regulator PaaX
MVNMEKKICTADYAKSTLEKRAGRIIRRARIQDAVALTLYGVSAIALAMLAGNTVQILRHIDPNFSKKRKPDYRIRQAVKRLESRGLVVRAGSGHMRSFRLSKKGEQYAERLHTTGRVHMPRPAKWDERWRIVIFDIWERRRNVRQRLRAILQRVGFVRLQNSVWIYPYECEELLAFIKTDLRLGRGILYIIAEGVEGDGYIRRHFGL